MILSLIVIVQYHPVRAEKNVPELQQGLDNGFDAEKERIEKEWNAVENGLRAEWEKFQAEVEQKWQVFVLSTKKEWVDYDDRKDTRSKVDFEDGKIEIEAVIPYEGPQALERAKEKIFEQAKKFLMKEIKVDEPILEKQIADKNGNLITRKNMVQYLKKEILPWIKADPTPYNSKDGQKRQRYSVKIDMVPRHLDIRARKYVPMVEENAERFNLDPQLIMAIIHTESYFNPLAVSDAGAIGLMQVVPRHAGREAYRNLYEQDWLIRPEYLYSPGVNIQLGSAYLSLLKNRHFSDIKDPVKNLYVSICAYNWGPTAVRQNIVDKYRIDKMTSSELYALLRNKTPGETRDYLARVTDRMGMYASYFR